MQASELMHVVRLAKIAYTHTRDVYAHIHIHDVMTN
jgi:hypothetical protein